MGRGEIDAGQYRRLGKGGREVWIEASYNPVFDAAGRPYKVIKFATDITAQKQRDADMASQIAAIGRVQAVIEFDLEGNILRANENFLTTVGYGEKEIVGQHHSIFVEPAYLEKMIPPGSFTNEAREAMANAYNGFKKGK